MLESHSEWMSLQVRQTRLAWISLVSAFVWRVCVLCVVCVCCVWCVCAVDNCWFKKRAKGTVAFHPTNTKICDPLFFFFFFFFFCPSVFGLVQSYVFLRGSGLDPSIAQFLGKGMSAEEMIAARSASRADGAAKRAAAPPPPPKK